LIQFHSLAPEIEEVELRELDLLSLKDLNVIVSLTILAALMTLVQYRIVK